MTEGDFNLISNDLKGKSTFNYLPYRGRQALELPLERYRVETSNPGHYLSLCLSINEASIRDLYVATGRNRRRIPI
jgi:hypothetical protein